MSTRLYSPNFKTRETMFNLKNIVSDDFVVIADEKEIATQLKRSYPVDMIPVKGDWIQENFDALERFKRIYLFIKEKKNQIADMVDRLGYDRCYIVDSNRTAADFETAKKESYQIKPRDLITTDDAIKERLRAVMNPVGGRLSGVDSCFGSHYGSVRFHDGEMTLWAGYNGGGKSAAVLQQINHWIIEEGHKVFLASMEIDAEISFKTMLNQATNSNPLTNEECDNASDYFAGRLWIFDVTSGVKSRVLIDRMEYARKKHGIKIFVIDSFTKCGVRAGDFAAEKEFAELLSDWSREHNVQVHIVVHVRKPDPKGNEEDPEMKIPSKYDVRGAGEIVDFAANIIVVWRNAVKKTCKRNIKDALELVSAGKTVDLDTNKRFRVALADSDERVAKGKRRFSPENLDDLKRLYAEIENFNDAVIMTYKCRMVGTDDHALKVWFNPQTRRFSESRSSQTCKVYDWLGRYNEQKIRNMVSDMDFHHNQFRMAV